MLIFGKALHKADHQTQTLLLAASIVTKLYRACRVGLDTIDPSEQVEEL
jgi:hypothetical protein